MKDTHVIKKYKNKMNFSERRKKKRKIDINHIEFHLLFILRASILNFIHNYSFEPLLTTRISAYYYIILYTYKNTQICTSNKFT